MKYRRDNKTRQGALRPGEEKMAGVIRGIDAVGYEALADGNPFQQKPTQIVENLVRVVNPTGTIGMIGVYFPQDPGGADKNAKQVIYPLPLGEFLRDLIIAGKVKPGQIVSQRLPLTAAPDAYQKFDERAQGYTKVLLKPGQAA